MAWEQRRGNWYYYPKRRVDGRVASEYIGRGDAGTSAAFSDHHAQTTRIEELQHEQGRWIAVD